MNWKVLQQTEIFKIEKWILRLINGWPGDNLVNGLFIFVYLLGIYFVTIQPISYFARTDDRIQEVAPGVCEFIQACIYNVTMISIFVYRKEFKKLVEDLENAYREIAKSPSLQDFYQEVLRFSFYMIIMYIVQVFTACFIYFYGPLLIDLWKLLQGRDDLSYPIALKSDFIFFDPRSSTFGFLVFTFISRMQLNAYVIQFCVMDLLLATILFYIGSFLRSISLRIKFLSAKMKSEKMSEAESIKVLKAIIVDYDKAIQMIKTFDKIFQIKILAQFVMFSVSFCFVLFNATVFLDDFGKLLLVSMFTLVTQTEQFVLCFLVSRIQRESLLVGHSAYDIGFYNYSSKLHRLIGFMIFRSQDNKIAITAGKFYTSDLESFGQALQTSIGYFALIRAVYSS